MELFFVPLVGYCVYAAFIHIYQSGECIHYTDYICGITVLKPLCRWLSPISKVLFPAPSWLSDESLGTRLKLVIFWKHTAALTKDIDILTRFVPRQLLLLAVRAGPYCKQREAGRGPWNKAIDVQLPILVSRSSRKHAIIFV